MIKVAIDGRRLQDGPPSGGGRWLRPLLSELRNQFELIVLTDARRQAPDLEGIEVVPLELSARLPEASWLHGPVTRWLRNFDGVFHATYNALPRGYGGRSVLTFHDLMWLEYPADMHPARRLAFSVQARWSARRANCITTVSEFSRRAIAAAYDVPAERIVLASNSVDLRFSPERGNEMSAFASALGIHGPYVVAMGGSPRRNLGVALGAWRALGPTRPALVVVGPEPLEAEPGLVRAGPLDDEAWAAVLAGARAFCYPSAFEGFGLPALEAAASGTPVVCARVSALPEVLGPAAEWCEEPTVAEITAGLARVLNDASRRDALALAGLARVAGLPSAADNAAALAQAYRRAAGC